MSRLLLIHHTPTSGTRELLEAARRGWSRPGLEEVEVLEREALQATAQDVLEADSCLLATPANFGYMSGALKHFFDSTFLAIGGALGADGGPAHGEVSTHGRPYGLWVHGRYDTGGATRSVTSIVQALGWRLAAAPVEIVGDVDDAAAERVEELAATVAALTL